MLIIFATIGVVLVVGTGDIVVDEWKHLQADDAAMLGAQSGGGQVDRAALYNNVVVLDHDAAIRTCNEQVATIAPDAQTSPAPCRITGNEIVAHVVIDVHLPVPVPYINHQVSSHRAATPIAGTTTPQ